MVALLLVPSMELLPNELLPNELLPIELVPNELVPNELVPIELLASELLASELLASELLLGAELLLRNAELLPITDPLPPELLDAVEPLEPPSSGLNHTSARERQTRLSGSDVSQ